MQDSTPSEALANRAREALRRGRPDVDCPPVEPLAETVEEGADAAVRKSKAA